ncbi:MULTISPECIES: DeoR/GlpR family DNA-binding transcription regulator [Virgibacillus]|uniref:HTH-type transcriptional repressor GlcR n=2 Tax=Virgibacillus TaxID=84406 RepID=A0A024QES9_9BACI|nr:MULTISPECIES: DeoR/GlpR family DNA-binding transcription regulator [Virgibacillus]EQB38912.1 hypothetical protein M948_00785 [Virgibacillus sp. CM-4]MYL43278.1 DeoR family transcriptional regulator [Virgibacillus massiliensis]GGJ67082.1 DeoR family transcriptional regulator [Virgibacillus kapii]CDQ41038.1 HTH-type transcriptional repressor GlcR [Virgibacillus massiliensis]
MLTTERHSLILEQLTKYKNLTIKDIIELTYASESTIRRDLTELEAQDKLVRIHGGATLPKRKLQEFSIKEKSTKNLHEKVQIAQYAVSLLNKGDCIFLDAGTTTMQMIPFLKDKEVVVVTNGLTHVEALMNYGIPTYVTGGYIKTKTGALIGAQTIQSISNYRFDKSFLGVNGFHKQFGYTTPDPEEASTKRQASAYALETFMLADQTKRNNVSFAKIADISDAALITCHLSEEAYKIFSDLTTVKVANQ